MLTALTADSAAFAADRLPLLDRGEEFIRPAVEAAVATVGQPRWYAPILVAAEALIRETFREEIGRDASGLMEDFIAEYLDTLQTSLTRMKPQPDRTAQVNLIVRAVTTGAVNAATFAATVEDQRAEDNDLGLEWVTMADKDVRETHRDVHGQVVPLGRSFLVAGVAMRYPGDPTAPIELWANCRCLCKPTFLTTVASSTGDPGGDMSTTDEVDTTDLVDPPTLADGELELEPVPWYSVLAPEGVPSGDRRMFAVDSLTWRDLPLPLKYQEADMPGHDGSVVVGRIDNIWRDGGLIKAEGVFRDTALAMDVVAQVAEGFIRGVSVDADSAVRELQAADGGVLEEGAEDFLEVFTSGRIASSTVCAIPAFAEAFLALGTWADSEHAPDDALPETDTTEAAEALAASAPEVTVTYLGAGLGATPTTSSSTFAIPPKTMDGPGWITNPRPTARLRNYWAHGPGAAKIKWGVPRDFYRCRTQLAKYVQNPEWLNGLCANIHYDALGFWPGNHRGAKMAVQDGAGGTAIQFVDTECEPCLLASGEVKDAAPWRPPDDWFTDPHLVGPSAVVVDEQGRVFGHLAAWDTCHLSYGDKQCVLPPKSPSDYAYYRLGSVLTASGQQVPVGKITLGTGHAPQGPGTNARTAMAHYDNTGTAVAYVAAGEDQYGIWVSGAVPPWVPDETVVALRAAVLSGDWRVYGGKKDLVAALAVNVPGFPIPRTSFGVEGTEQVSLVASGMVVPERTYITETTTLLMRSIIGQVLAERKRAARLEDLRAQARADRIAELRLTKN